MVYNNKQYWKRAPYPYFSKCYQQLDKEEQWSVDRNLHNMAHVKEPTEHYENIACLECGPGWHLFGMKLGGDGYKRLAVLIYFDKEQYIMHPTSIRKINSKHILNN